LSEFEVLKKSKLPAQGRQGLIKNTIIFRSSYFIILYFIFLLFVRSFWIKIMFWCKLCSFTLKQAAEVLSQGLLGYVSFLNIYKKNSFHYNPGESQNNFVKVSIHLQHTRNVTFSEWRAMIHMNMLDWHESKNIIEINSAIWYHLGHKVHELGL
jgi:hypothetical protein